MHWLFWETNPELVDLDRDANYVIARIAEFGRMTDVDWMRATYGDERIHDFFRHVGHPELSPRTVSFWRAYFHATHEIWASPPAWRTNSSVPWVS